MTAPLKSREPITVPVALGNRAKRSFRTPCIAAMSSSLNPCAEANFEVPLERERKYSK